MTNQSRSLERLYIIQNKCNEWISNYQQFQLRNDSRLKKQHHQILSLKRKTEKAIYQLNIEKISSEDIGSIPVSKNILEHRKIERTLQKDKINQFREEKLQIIKAIESTSNEELLQNILDEWEHLSKKYIELGLDTFLDINKSVDNIILDPIREFIVEAKYFIHLSSTIDNEDIKIIVEKVKSWIEQANKIVQTIESLDKYLVEWKKISLLWVESGFSQINNFSNNVLSSLNSLKELKSIIEKFLSEVEKNFTVLLSDKINKAKSWLKTIELLLTNAEKITQDNNNNNHLPDWFDQLQSEWTRLNIKEIIFSKLDGDLIIKLDLFVKNAESWISYALTSKSVILEQKIKQVGLWIEDIRTILKLHQESKSLLEDFKNKDYEAIFEKLKTLWRELNGSEDIINNSEIDEILLSKIKDLKVKSDQFLILSNSLLNKLTNSEDAKQLENWILQIIKFSSEIYNFKDIVEKYIALLKKWSDSELNNFINESNKVTEAAIGQISNFTNEIKIFIASAYSIKNADLAEKIKLTSEWLKSSEDILDKASELLGLISADSNQNNLPDWYDQLRKLWSDIEKNDLTAGTNINNALFGKINIFRIEAEKWLSRATNESDKLQKEIENVRQWLDIGINCLNKFSNFIEDIKEGDYLSVYEKIKTGWQSIDNIDDILNGTHIDNKILAKVKSLKEEAEAWLANVLTSGKAEGKMTPEVVEILALADNFLSFVLTKNKIEDHSMEFQEDGIIIKIQENKKLSTQEIEDLIGEFSGGLDDSLKNKLISVINKINQEILSLNLEIDAAFRKTINSGAESADVFIKSKRDYESVMKKQKQVEKLLDSLRKVVVGAITAALIPANPVAASIVGGLLSGTVSDFSSLAKFLSDQAAESSESLADIGRIGSLFLPSNDNSSFAIAESEGLVSLNDLFNKLVSSKFEDIKIHVTKLNAELDAIYKSLYKLDQKGLDECKITIANGAHKWKNVHKQVTNNYIRAKETRINKQKAYWQLSRAQYASWLVKKSDTLIVDQVIDKLSDFKILSEASVNWEKGTKADIAKGLGWLLGGWASFGYDKKIKSLNKWAKSEIVYLSKEESWIGTFG